MLKNHYVREEKIMADKTKTEQKTNAIRILDKAKIQYQFHSYAGTDAISGIEVAAVLGQNPDKVFKTLVTVGKSKQYFVFIIPVNKELDLKKAAKSVDEKSIEMIKSKDLFALTGYIHGGCSPIGMKKFFTTTIDSSAKDFETIMFSAGKIGSQIELGISSLEKVIKFNLCNITVD